MTRLTSRDEAPFHAVRADGTGPAADDMESTMFNWPVSSKALQGAARACPALTDPAELTTAEQDAVSGGLNPQPLPPIVHERF